MHRSGAVNMRYCHDLMWIFFYWPFTDLELFCSFIHSYTVYILRAVSPSIHSVFKQYVDKLQKT